MLNCHQVTRLLSESRERKLKLTEKLNLHMHTMMCKACKNFGKQAGIIGRAMKSFSEKNLPESQLDSKIDESKK